MSQQKLEGLLWEKPRIPQDEKNRVIGRFGPRLVQSLLGGDILDNADEHGDILHDELGLIEVKMSSSRRQPSFGEEQLFRHFQSAETGYHYAFVRYGNPSQFTGKLTKAGKPQRLTLLNRIAKSPSQVTHFLAERTKEVFLIDISILCAVWSCDPVRCMQVSKGGYERPCINIPMEVLTGLANADPLTFQRFDLETHSYSISSEKVEGRVGDHVVPVTLHRVLKPQTKENSNLCLDFDLLEPTGTEGAHTPA